MRSLCQLAYIDETIDREAFDCGHARLNRWFRKAALEHANKSLSATYVAVQMRNPVEAMGFYTLTISTLKAWIFPELTHGIPKDIPVFLLTRLAVAKPYRKTGLGSSLLLDAYWRCERASWPVSGAGLAVQAGEEARAFYLGNHFVQSQAQPGLLFRKF